MNIDSNIYTCICNCTAVATKKEPLQTNKVDVIIFYIYLDTYISD